MSDETKPINAILVEGDPDWRAVLVPFLEQNGMKVSACACAVDALRVLEERPGF
jgi:DNA-binding response OmpR family regulator